MNTNDRNESVVGAGDFPTEVRASFAFVEELGFAVKESLPTVVKYGRDGFTLVVHFDPRSHEIDLALCVMHECYSMAEILRASDPATAQKYRSWAATTPESMRKGTKSLATLLATHGSRGLAGEAEYFRRLREQRRLWSQSYELEVLEARNRSLADKAFRAGRYWEAVAMYEQIAHSLTPAERKKLAVARRRLADGMAE